LRLSPRPPASTLFPYTTLFRSGRLVVAHGVVAVAIADVDDLPRVGFRLVVEHRTAGAGAVGIRIPVEVRAQRPVAVEAVQVLQRSEEHTSELQSRENLVCRLLL